jgi:hypothetical protein
MPLGVGALHSKPRPQPFEAVSIAEMPDPYVRQYLLQV